VADAEVKVAIVGDNSSLQRSLSESQSTLASFGRIVGKVAIAAGVAAAGGLALITKASVEAASAAQQSLGGTQAVFGKYADQVIRDGRRAADAFGLSGNQYRESANIIGALLLNQGEQQDKLADSTKNLIGQAADLAATYGGTTKDAVDALASAFKGEFDPLQNFGITLLQSKVNLEAMRLAGVKTTADFGKLSSATQTAYKRQATMSLITQQSGIAQGQFQKQLGTVAEQSQVLGAQWENLKTKIGKALLPVVSVLLTRLNNDLMPTLRQLAKTYLPAVQSALIDLVQSDPSEWLGDAGDKARGFSAALGEVDWGELGRSASELIDTLKQLGPALADVSIQEVNDGIRVFGTVVGFAADHLDTLEKLLPFIVGGFLALKAAQVLNSIAGRDSIVGLVAQWVATRRLVAAQRELVAITREVAVAQGVQLGSTEALAAGSTTLTGSLSKLGPAARTAAGIGGLALLTVGATSSNDSLAELSTMAGAVATGFAVAGPWGAAIGAGIASAQAFAAANDELSDSLAAIDTAKASGDLDTYAASIDNAQQSLDKYRAKQDESHPIADSLPFGLGALTQMDKYRSTLDEITGANDRAQDAISESKRELEGFRDGTLRTFNPVRDFADGIGLIVQNALDEADALTKATDAMRDKRREASRGLDAELDYQQAIDDADAALKENGRTVNKSTEAGRANLRSLTSLADAWNNQSNATKNARGSLSAARKGFVDTAQSMGLSEQAAKRLADRLFEIPPKRQTQIQLDGVDSATTKAKTLRDIMAQLKTKDIYVTLHYQTIGNKPKAPTPGGTPRLASPTEQKRETDKMRQYGERLGDAFGKGAADGADKHKPSLVDKLFGDVSSLDKIKAGLDSIAQIVEKTVSRRVKDDKAAARRSKAILDDLSKREKALRKVGAAQDKLSSTLAQAKQDLQDAKEAAVSYATALRDAFVSFGDISQLGKTSSGGTSLALLLKQLRQRAKDAAEFDRLIQQLAAMNLSQTQIEQLTAQGPEGALATARAIAQGGQAAVDEINKLSLQIEGSGSSLGAALAARYKQAGIDSAKAYVDELTRQQNALNKTARQMAHALVAAMQADLAAQPKQSKTPDGDKGENSRQSVTVRLTSQQVSQIERGREIQVDLDAYRAAGGRART
jgi:hypothetical protein